jgi:hypothetical protein
MSQSSSHDCSTGGRYFGLLEYQEPLPVAIAINSWGRRVYPMLLLKNQIEEICFNEHSFEANRFGLVVH